MAWGKPSECVGESDGIVPLQERTLSAVASCHAVYFFAKQLSRPALPPIHWFRPHTGSGRRLSLVLPWFEADYRCGSRGTVRVPMLVRILRTYRLSEILMLAAATTLCVVVSEIYPYW
jgi:hypothetical protein